MHANNQYDLIEPININGNTPAEVKAADSSFYIDTADNIDSTEALELLLSIDYEYRSSQYTTERVSFY